jgi:hypothetical protein
MKFDSLCFSTQLSKAKIAGLLVKPYVSRQVFNQNRTFAASYIDFASTQIDFEKINFYKLLYHKSFNIDSVKIDQSRLHLYKDKRLPIDSTKQIPMFLTSLYNAPVPIKLNGIKLKNLTLKYEETVPHSNSDARILLENINILASNLTNEPKALINHDTALLNVNGLIMGKGYFETKFMFFLNTPKNKYSYSGFVKSFPITYLNDYFVNSVFVRIPSGKLNRLKFSIIANDDYALGRLHFNYQGLKIEVLDKNVEAGKENRKAILSLLANGLLQSCNPRYPGTPSRVGQVFYQRNPNKSEVNFWLMSLISGVKSTMGFNSRQARKVLKNEKEILNEIEKP